MTIPDPFDKYKGIGKPKKSSSKKLSVKKIAGVTIDDPKRKTVYHKAEGLGAIPAEIGNYATDFLRNSMNFGSDVGDFLMSRKPGTAQIGNRAFGKREVQGKKRGNSLPPTASAPMPEDDMGGSGEGAPELSFADYLAMANELSTGGTDYSALMGRLRGNASEGDARLNAMYSQLQSSFANDAGAIGGAYDEAAASQKAAAEAAAAQTNAGYDAARSNQTQQFKDLGIEEAAATIASSGSGTLGSDQAVSNANIAQVGGINQQQTAANKGTGLAYNTRITQAAGAEGASQRAALQQQLNNKLAELEVAQSTEAGQRQDSNWERASFLADWDNSAAQRRAAANAGPSPEDLFIQSKMAGQDLENQKRAFELSTLMGGGRSPGDSYAQVQALAQQSGIDPSDQEAMGSFIDQLSKAVKL